MEILEIIKESFIFPSNNLGKLAIYIALTFIVGLLLASGIILTALSFLDASYLAVIGIIILIAGIIVSLIISGYQISILKTGIDQADEAPGFEWKDNLVTGVKYLFVTIVYFIIPAIVVLIIGLVTNVPGNLMKVFEEAALSPANVTATTTSTGFTASTVSQSTASAFLSSFAITAIVALIVFIIFIFLKLMAQSRLANTGSLGEALNIPEAFRDIGRIGFGKVIAVVLLTVILIAVIQGILGYIYGRVPQVSIISVIVTPYLTFFANRATGLLYSDIA